MSLTLFFTFVSLQRRVNKPPEEGDSAHPYQDGHCRGGIEDDKRESGWPAVVSDEGEEHDADDEHVVQEIEQAVLADEAQGFPIPHDIEHQQRHRDGASQDKRFLGHTTHVVVVGAVHDVTAAREQPEDDGKQHDYCGDVQHIVLPPAVVERTLAVIITQQEEYKEVECAL